MNCRRCTYLGAYETTKDGNTVKLVLPFPHFLWILANQPEILKGKANKVNKNGEDNK